MKFSLLAIILLSISAHGQNILFHEDFESGYANWTMTGIWNAQDASEPCTSVQVPFPSGTHCAWFGESNSCGYQSGWTNHDYLTCTQPIVLPSTSASIALTFRSWSQTENDLTAEWDARWPEIRLLGGTAWTKLPQVNDLTAWKLDTYDISRWAGQTIELRFEFFPNDGYGNQFIGWLIDDISIVEQTESAINVCSGDGSWRPCPCSNTGGSGRGCASTLSATGAGVRGVGSPSIASDSFTLQMDGMSPAAATLFQASAFFDWNAPGLAGDGVTCVSGSFVRLVTRFAPGGSLNFPTVGDAAISLLGSTLVGQTRYYGARYRDSAVFCTPATFNITNTIAATWRP